MEAPSSVNGGKYCTIYKDDWFNRVTVSINPIMC